MTEIWTKWESRVVNGVFPLRRFLGRSNHSVVFLTEYKAKELPNAAIKLIPADPALTEAQLAQWRSIAHLSHPHLLRLFEADRCQLGGHNFLFVVMEYAEQTLAQILPNRALTLGEVREMLPPTLDALAFLHRKNLVQGYPKPPNFLVVDDQLKLASDTIRPAGQSKANSVKPSVYDPPEAKSGMISAAGDVWALGVTLVETLTQGPPEWPDERHESVSLPATLPPAYVDIIRRCLSRNPAHRPTVIELADQIKEVPPAPAVSVAHPVEVTQPIVVAQPVVAQPVVAQPVVAQPVVAQPVVAQPVVHEAPKPAARPREPAKRNLFVPATALTLMALVAVWAGVSLFKSHRNPHQSASSASQAPPLDAPTPVAAPQNPTAAPAPIAAPAAKTQVSSVIHEEIPDVPLRVREAIRGHIKVTVRVIVDPSGNVVAETLVVPGSSKYFAHLAVEAARKWKFSPADKQDSQKWLLRFDFSRGGTAGRAAAT